MFSAATGIYGGAAGPSSQLFYQSGVAHGVNIYWYRHLQHVPRGTVATLALCYGCGYAVVGHAYYIAHEFFDALPVHQFKVCITCELLHVWMLTLREPQLGGGKY